MPDVSGVLCEETGRRVVVRRRLPDGSATDLIGDLQRADATGVEVLPEFAGPVTVAAADIIATRGLPERTVRPQSSRDLLSRMMHRGWPGLEQRRLGGWILVASQGFTGRGNSALAIGEPVGSLPDALAVVEEFYAERGLPARVQVSTGPAGAVTASEAALIAELTARGYVPDDPTLVMLARLSRTKPEPTRPEPTQPEPTQPARTRPDPTRPDRTRPARTRPESTRPDPTQPDPTQPDPTRPEPTRSRTLDEPPLTFDWSPQPGPDWLALCRYRGGALPPIAVRVLCASRDHRFLTVRTPAGDPIACARLAVLDDWAGLTGLEVAPTHRGRGVATATLAEALRAAVLAGAGYSYLQVLADNAIAIEVYRRAGYAPHHGYRYWTRPG